MEKELMGMCGTYCAECEWKEPTNCPGCQKSQSQMFWGQCGVAKCAIEKKHHHCGHCSALPCQPLQEAFDNPEHGDNGERLTNLKSWASGNDTYLSLSKKK
jgi:hypothetical protein